MNRKPHTAEARLKISLSKKGSKHSLATRLKMSKTRKGIKRPPRSLDWRMNQRNSMLVSVPRGEESPFWKGGQGLVEEIRKCFMYRQWRSDIFTRDDFTCQMCGQKGGDINADHIDPFVLIIKRNNIKTIFDALACQELWNINNGRTLCVKCHRTTKTYGKRT